ncbi:MAG TPA: hypothetical protein VLB68_26755 [Pyrinomonadaceae bacterium]|nr:hypothetical protein [Pyrinomonadaceae bacterium]
MSEADGNRGSLLNDDPEAGLSFFSDWQRVTSLVIAIAYLFVAPFLFPANSWSHLISDIILRILSLAFPLACIWFADDMAEFHGGTLFPRITTASSGRFVRLGGWLLLLLPVLVFLLVRLLESLYLR